MTIGPDLLVAALENEAVAQGEVLVRGSQVRALVRPPSFFRHLERDELRFKTGATVVPGVEPRAAPRSPGKRGVTHHLFVAGLRFIIGARGFSGADTNRCE